MTLIKTLKTISILAGLGAVLILLQSSRVAAHIAAGEPPDRVQPGQYLVASPAQNPAATLRDGSHDFDFEIGSWKIHLKKLMHPLTGSTTWVEFDDREIPEQRGTARWRHGALLVIHTAGRKSREGNQHCRACQCSSHNHSGGYSFTRV